MIIKKQALFQYLINSDNSKPAAKSLVSLWPIIKLIEGHSKPGGLYPFHVQLHKNKADKYGLPSIICGMKTLHQTAFNYLKRRLNK